MLHWSIPKIAGALGHAGSSGRHLAQRLSGLVRYRMLRRSEEQNNRCEALKLQSTPIHSILHVPSLSLTELQDVNDRTVQVCCSAPAVALSKIVKAPDECAGVSRVHRSLNAQGAHSMQRLTTSGTLSHCSILLDYSRPTGACKMLRLV